MNVNHTPGPWEIGARIIEGVHTKGYTIQSPGKRALARTVPYFGDDGEILDDGLANARLIAAAPDLLAALKEAEKHYGPDHPAIIWQKVRAVILRATEGK